MPRIALPGEKISSIEEYEAGENTFDDGEAVRSAVAGTVNLDGGERIATVSKTQKQLAPVAKDVVVGTVAAVMSSMIAVSINYINGVPTRAGIECICSTRNMRRRTVALAGDVVALRIISLNNGTLHATVGETALGVLFTKCRKCGGGVLLYRDAIKCKECSWIDERELSGDFGKADFLG